MPERFDVSLAFDIEAVHEVLENLRIGLSVCHLTFLRSLAQSSYNF